MHYFDGTPAQLGDTIAKAPEAAPEHYDGMLKAHETAVVVRLHPGSDTCNVEAVVARPRDPSRFYGHIYVSGPATVGGAAASLDPFTATSKAFRLVARSGA